MPELPEVETTKNGLLELLGPDQVINKLEIKCAELRWPVEKSLVNKVKNQKIRTLTRRAKYLLWHLDNGVLISHLGMTGTWRLAPKGSEKKHDHIFIHLKDGRRLAFNDPRRFGLLEFSDSEANYHRFSHLGVEPLSEEFSLDYLWPLMRNKQVAIKNFIMDQKYVVGVGNIYAVESLFLSGIRPTRKTMKVTKKEAELFIKHIKETLRVAIEAGGSTISDFKNTNGQSGYFQHNFQLYGREGEACYKCGKTLKNTTLGGRQSVWCGQCQK